MREPMTTNSSEPSEVDAGVGGISSPVTAPVVGAAGVVVVVVVGVDVVVVAGAAKATEPMVSAKAAAPPSKNESRFVVERK